MPAVAVGARADAGSSGPLEAPLLEPNAPRDHSLLWRHAVAKTAAQPAPPSSFTALWWDAVRMSRQRRTERNLLSQHPSVKSLPTQPEAPPNRRSVSLTKMVRQKTWGMSTRGLTTFDAYLSACETMWGVIIFLKFGAVLQRGGLLASLGVLAFSALTQVFNCLAVSAVATNGLHEGAHSLLVANLGQTWGATTSLLYYLGMSALATVEMCGAVDALDVLMHREEAMPDYVTSSAYYDTGVIGSVGILLLSLLRGYNSHLVHVVGTVVLIAFCLTLACTLIGAGRSFAFANLAANLLPLDGHVSLADISFMLTFIYPCFAGIFQPVNKASQLKTPYASVPKATIGSVLTSAAVFAAILAAIACSAPLSSIEEEDFLLAAWPSKYFGIVGTLIVGIGSCVSCLDVAPTILQAIAAEEVVPGLSWLGLDRLSGKHQEPQRATAFTAALAVPFAWLGSIDLVALATALLFLQMYFTMDLCCLLLASLHSPGWRPKWPKITPWQAASAAMLCAATVALIDVTLMLCVVVAKLVVASVISLLTGEQEMGTGDAIAGLTYSVALQALYALQEDVALASDSGVARTPVTWRPQLLCLVHSAYTRSELPSADREATALLSLAHHLKEGRGLSLVATVAAPDALRGATKKEQREAAKARLEALCERSDLRAFTDVTLSEDIKLALGVLLDCCGVGALRPNTVAMSCVLPASEERAGELVASMRLSAESEKAQLLLCISETTAVSYLVPRRRSKQGSELLNQLEGTLDVWWVAHDGALPLVIAHLLQMHETFSKCVLRVFMYLSLEEEEARADCEETEERLRIFLSMLRISASHVEVLPQLRKVGTSHSEATVNSMIALNRAMADACEARLTYLIISNIPEMQQGHLAEPSTYAGLLSTVCNGLPPVLLVSGGGSPICFH